MTDPTNSQGQDGEQFNNQQPESPFVPQDTPGSAPQADFSAPADDQQFSAPAGDQFSAPAGDQYSAPAGDQFGAPAGDPYGAPAGGQPPYGAPTGDQYGQPNYGAPAGGQPQYGAPGQPQYGAGGHGQPQVSPQEEVEQAKNAHMFSAIGAIFGVGWLISLIMYLTQKDKGPFIKQESASAMNFHISFAIYTVGIYVISMILMFVIIGFVTILGALVTYAMSIIFGFVNASRVGNGGVSNYPLSIKFVK